MKSNSKALWVIFKVEKTKELLYFWEVIDVVIKVITLNQPFLEMLKMI